MCERFARSVLGLALAPVPPRALSHPETLLSRPALKIHPTTCMNLSKDSDEESLTNGRRGSCCGSTKSIIRALYHSEIRQAFPTPERHIDPYVFLAPVSGAGSPGKQVGICCCGRQIIICWTPDCPENDLSVLPPVATSEMGSPKNGSSRAHNTSPRGRFS